MADTSAILAQLIFGLVHGVLLGCVFALIAHGLNLIWGIAKVVNIAHGEFLMLGAYGAYFLNLFLGFNPLLAAPIDAALGLAAGLGFYFGFLHRELRGKEAMTLQSEMVTLVATFGLTRLGGRLVPSFRCEDLGLEVVNAPRLFGDQARRCLQRGLHLALRDRHGGCG